MKILLAILASLFSGIGGHFVNRRWDRALFFLCLGLGLVGLYIALSFGGEQHQILLQSGPDRTVFTPPVLVFICIWALSILLTIYDAIRPNVELQHSWTRQGLFGAFFLSLFIMVPLGVFSWTTLASVWIQHDFARSSYNETHTVSNNYFSKYINFGHMEGSHRDLSEPPKGELYLSGQFLFEGQPAPDIDLVVILNSKYRVPNLRTDRDGLFHIKVPPGEWHVTLIDVEGWKNAPENADKFSVIRPNEAKYIYGESYYRMGFMGESLGIPIVATVRPGEKPLSLRIVRNIPINWPVEGDDAVNASVEKDILKWEAVSNADRYLAKIWRIERDGLFSTTSYPVLSKDIQTTSLPLSELTVSTNSRGEMEYKLEVLAFDKEGNFLGQSAEHSSEALFMLPDGIALVEDIPTSNRSVSPEFSQQEVNEFTMNNGRLDTVDFLIGDGLYAEALTVLQKVEGKSEPGRLLALQGYLSAVQGDCETANRLFTDAIAEAGNHCVRERYRAECGLN